MRPRHRRILDGCKPAAAVSIGQRCSFPSAVPPKGFGRQIEVMHSWLDEICGSGGLAMAPAGFAGVVDGAEPLYLEAAASAYAFIARFCCGYWFETIGAAPRRRRLGACETP